MNTLGIILFLNKSFTFIVPFIALIFIYQLMFKGLRTYFRRFDTDIPLVSLNTSQYPLLIVYFCLGLKFAVQQIKIQGINNFFFSAIDITIEIVITIWIVQLLQKVVFYFIKIYVKENESMLLDVIIPLLEAVVPFLIYLVGLAFILQTLGFDLQGFWVSIGGASLLVGFALKDILANFFSGLVLLVDTPFQYGDLISLEDGTLAMLQKIGLRVTHLYVFSTHNDIYVPNGLLESQKITNLSRPTNFYKYSISLEIPLSFDVNEVKQIIHNIVLAHPDTLGDIDEKLSLIGEYYLDKNLFEQQKIGKERIEIEISVKQKLEDIDMSLEILFSTMEFIQKAALSQDEIDNIKQELKEIINSIGLEASEDAIDYKTINNLNETKDDDGLIELVRHWYRSSIKDPNLSEEDSFIISQEWERKISLLIKRFSRLHNKILNYEKEQRRLKDYVLEEKQWLKEKFKQPRMKWQDPTIYMEEVNLEQNSFFSKFTLDYFIDDVKLEYCKRNERIKSQIYLEISKYFEQMK